MIDFCLDKHSPVPFYRQIVDLILMGIARRRIAPGDRLPTVRELAVRLEVNPNTVAKAYSQLRLLGVLSTQQGSGVFVCSQPTGSESAGRRARVTTELCQDFVGRAHLLGIGIDELIRHLQQMRKVDNGM